MRAAALLLVFGALLHAQTTCVNCAGGSSGATSVGLSMPSTLCAVTNSPVTTTGTLTCSYATGQTGNLILGSNSSGNVGLMNLTTTQLPSGVMLGSNNLSDLGSASTARTNLGLATVASSGSYTDLSNKPSIPSAFPLTTVQELTTNNGSGNVTTFTVTFPQTTAASGNTAFMIVAADGSQTITTPTGWTVDINQAQATFSRIMLLHKATASDTSATFTNVSGAAYAVYFFEVSGSHALDQSSVGGVANEFWVPMPAITPTANAVVFAMLASTQNGATILPVIDNTLSPNWKTLLSAAAQTAGGRFLCGFVSTVPATNVSTKPPGINIATGMPLFSGGGIAYATFSIL